MQAGPRQAIRCRMWGGLSWRHRCFVDAGNRDTMFVNSVESSRVTQDSAKGPPLLPQVSPRRPPKRPAD